MLGVTVTNHLSVSEHVRDVISRCAQSIYALKLLRSHGMNDDELRTINKSAVLAKFAVPSWWGFTTADDKRRLEAFVRRAVRLNLRSINKAPTIAQLVGQLEDSLFQAKLDNERHVIHHLLPPYVSNTYNLRQRSHRRHY